MVSTSQWLAHFSSHSLFQFLYFTYLQLCSTFHCVAGLPSFLRVLPSFSPSTPASFSPLSTFPPLSSLHTLNFVFVKHTLCLTNPSNSSAFSREVVPQCGEVVGTQATPNCHGNPRHMLSVTHHTLNHWEPWVRRKL